MLLKRFLAPQVAEVIMSSGERRLLESHRREITVVFCDLRGFTGLVVLFNDPLPCPDPTARAVRMALEMRDCVDELSRTWRKHGHDLGFGVGIAQGVATLGRIGFGGRFDYAAIGPLSNLASRLCDEAADGEILISQRALAAVVGLVEAEPAGDLTLKGFVRPVTAHRVRGSRQ